MEIAKMDRELQILVEHESLRLDRLHRLNYDDNYKKYVVYMIEEFLVLLLAYNERII